jgi:hypothetical protein
MRRNSKAIQQLQYEVCKVISNIGGKIKWTKEYGFLARLNYYLSRKEPVINIEALFLGERFGIILTDQQIPGKIASSKYRIITASSLPDFKQQFEALKQEKLA